MTDEKNNKRFNFAVSESLLKAIDNYRKDIGGDFPPARAEAVRQLLKDSLRAKGYDTGGD